MFYQYNYFGKINHTQSNYNENTQGVDQDSPVNSLLQYISSCNWI